jgi:predicted ATPase
MLIRTPDYHLRVFVSSTMKELAEERKVVRQAIRTLRLAPVMFEIGARPHPAEELYQSYLSQSQIFIGIYWQSYGWIAPGNQISGLEDEYNLSSNMPRLIYIKNPAPEREPALADLLKRIRNDNTSSYTYFSTAEELSELVQNDLAVLLSERFESALHRSQPNLSAKNHKTSNIPIPRNPLVGRENEYAQICDLLKREDIALITLTGPGGTGKSRLAIQVGLEMLEHFKDGVFLTGLESITDPDLVIPTIAQSFSLRETPDGLSIHDMLREYLQDKHTLLLLDNFEQVVESANFVAELLEMCPGLKCIVTSRTPLRLRAEKEFPVHPLSVPPLHDTPAPELLSKYAAVELFTQRAQAVRPDFSITQANASTIAAICHRLDGLPLAIELAAARTKLLTPHSLLARLDHRFDLLTGGTRDLPERQRTLRRAIDWSYNLLSDLEKMLFRRLAVFIGGFTLEAAQAVCSLDGDLDLELEDALSSLIDNNLVSQLQEHEFGPRYGMLSTIHEYATQRLMESGDYETVHRQHAEYFLDFVLRVEPLVRSAERVRWQDVMQQDYGNIRAVLEHANQSDRCLIIGQQIVIAIGLYWQICGYLDEGQHWSIKMLARCDYTTPLNIHAGLLCIRGLLAWAKGDQLTAAEILEMGLELSRKQNDHGPLSRALMFMGMLNSAARELENATGKFQEAIAIFRKHNDLWSEAVSLSFLGNVSLYQNDFTRALALYDESISLARKQGDPWCLMPALMASAQVAILNEDFDAAQQKLVEVLGVLYITGDHWSQAWTLIDLGHVAFRQGDRDQAATYILEALSLAHTFGNQRALIIALAKAAALIAADGHQEQPDLVLAANLCGVAAQYLDMPGIFLWLNTRSIYEHAITHARSLMSATAWEKGYSEGQSMPVDRAADLAMQALSA